jgi:hypothetical protein
MILKLNLRLPLQVAPVSRTLVGFALAGSRFADAGAVTPARSIWDYGAYAACYWGCVAGGGGAGGEGECGGECSKKYL